MTLFVRLPLADDFAKSEGRTKWGTFNVDHIACIIPSNHEECLVNVNPRGKKDTYDQFILACSYEEATRIINYALISDSIHYVLSE